MLTEACYVGADLANHLETFDVPNSNYETVIMLVELAPQVNTGLHTHPGFDAAYSRWSVLARPSRSSPRSKGG